MRDPVYIDAFMKATLQLPDPEKHGLNEVVINFEDPLVKRLDGKPIIRQLHFVRKELFNFHSNKTIKYWVWLGVIAVLPTTPPAKGGKQ